MRKTKLKWSEMNKKQRVLFVIDWILRGVLIVMCSILIGAFVFSCFGTASGATAYADDGSSEQVTISDNSAADTAYVNSGLDQYNLNLLYYPNTPLTPKNGFTYSVSNGVFTLSANNVSNHSPLFFGQVYLNSGVTYTLYCPDIPPDFVFVVVYSTNGGSSFDYDFNVSSFNSLTVFDYTAPSGLCSFIFQLDGTVSSFNSLDLSPMLIEGSYTLENIPSFQPNLKYIYEDGYTSGNSAGYDDGYNKGFDDGYNEANSSRQISLADSTNTEGYVLQTQTPPGNCGLSYSGNSITATGFPFQKTIPSIKWKLPQTLPSGTLISVSCDFAVSSVSSLVVAYLSGSDVIDLVSLTNGSFSAFTNVNSDIDTLIVYVPGAFEFTVSDLIIQTVGGDSQSIGQNFYDKGYDVGYSTGFQEGFNSSGNGGFGWLISSVQSFLDTKFFGDFGVGTLLYVGLGIALASLFIKFFAGG